MALPHGGDRDITPVARAIEDAGADTLVIVLVRPDSVMAVGLLGRARTPPFDLVSELQV